MPTIEVFDPPMCCSTGVCGTTVDPALPRFAADLEWLEERGVNVIRYNLAQDPSSYTSNDSVLDAIQRFGTDCLPLILVDGRTVSQGGYPSRAELAALAGLEPEQEERRMSPAMENCFRALESGKLLFISVQDGSGANNDAAMRGVRDFRQDGGFASATEIVEIDARDSSEREFVRELGIGSDAQLPMTLLLMPPNVVVGRFTGPTDKRMLVEALQAALTRCRPGSGCCG